MHCKKVLVTFLLTILAIDVPNVFRNGMIQYQKASTINKAQIIVTLNIVKTNIDLAGVKVAFFEEIATLFQHKFKMAF